MNILIPWNETYELNIKEIDQQHMKFIDMINVLYDSITQKAHNDVLEATIIDMRDYAFVHFKTEEKYFDEIGFKDADFHKVQHHFFLEQIEKFQAEFQNYEPTLAVEVLTFLHEWFLNHIVELDKKYVPIFIDHGIR